MSKKHNIKIVDFGLAVRLTHDRPERNTLCGTPHYLAPYIIFFIHFLIKLNILCIYLIIEN